MHATRSHIVKIQARNRQCELEMLRAEQHASLHGQSIVDNHPLVIADADPRLLHLASMQVAQHQASFHPHLPPEFLICDFAVLLNR